MSERLDVAVVKAYPTLSRSRAAKLIEQGLVTVNGALRTKASYEVQAGDTVVAQTEPPTEYTLEPVEMPLDIVYEDEWLAIVNKPRGLVVHPAPGHLDDTLVHGLRARFAQLSDLGGELRPGIVHRIDKDTSGLLVIAKDNFAHQKLQEQLESRQMSREYLAVCKGCFSQKEFEVEKPIDRHPVDRKKMAIVDGGRYAKTLFCVIDGNHDFSLLKCSLTTGRTHQIRVHLMSLGHSIVGDRVYGKPAKVNFAGQALHAYQIKFVHPKTGKEMIFWAEPPEDLQQLCKKCKLSLPQPEEIDRWKKQKNILDFTR